MGEPRPRVRGIELKIAVLAQAPDYVNVAGCVLIADFDQPILVTAGIEQLSVRSLLNRVAMRPVVGGRGQVIRSASADRRAGFSENRLARDIQMIEGVPSPDYVQIAVEYNDHVPKHVHWPRALDVR